MDTSILTVLIQDGITTGAIYALLSLALVRESAEACDTGMAGPQVLELPRGEFELEPEIMTGDILWRCLLLNDLGDVADMGEACRLAQRLMDKVMTAPE